MAPSITQHNFKIYSLPTAEMHHSRNPLRVSVESCMIWLEMTKGLLFTFIIFWSKVNIINQIKMILYEDEKISVARSIT